MDLDLLRSLMTVAAITLIGLGLVIWLFVIIVTSLRDRKYWNRRRY
jgi:hypothetical protein